MAAPSAVATRDGQVDFSGGIDSIKVTTMESPQNPNGLHRNQLAWLNNGTIRDGGITQRAGWTKLGTIHDGSALYQGGEVYDPADENPYLMLSIGGHIYQVFPDAVTNLLDLSVQPITPQPTLTVQTLIGTGVFLPAGTVIHTGSGTYTLAQNVMFPPTPGSITFNITTYWTGPVPLTYNSGGNKITAASSSVGTPPGTQFINPPALPQAFFRQAEQFMVIQAGDLVTLPLIWDGSQLRRSKGITNPLLAVSTNGINEIPPAGPMDYYMGRLWYAQGRKYSAGDIVGGPAGTAGYQFRDAVLNVTENPLAVGGDGFTVPTQDGNITCLRHNGAIDAALGQGRLFTFTKRSVYALQVPVTRLDWIGANNSNQPLQTVVQINNGSVNDRSVVAVNGDLYYHSYEPQIRSLITAVRYFNQPGNIPISANENRIMKFIDRSNLGFISGIFFNNRLLETTLPKQLPQGVVHQAIIPLDFMPISSFREQQPPVWEGMMEGLDILQLFTATVRGTERAFAVVVNRDNGHIELWELSLEDRFENDGTDQENRVSWNFETPAYNWQDEFSLKKLLSGELWVDRLFGEVVFKIEWRPDGDPCWKVWDQFKQCSARNSCEDVNNPICYPLVPFKESFRSTLTLPAPPESCESITGRPAYIAYQFQFRITIKGFCRIRGLVWHAGPVEREMYAVVRACPT
jgi:hypothetical protein